MKRKHLIAIGFWVLLVLAVASASVGRVFDAVLIGLWFLLLAIGPIWKLALWRRHRNDPLKRDETVSSGQSQLHPEWFRRFAFDEDSAAESKR